VDESRRLSVPAIFEHMKDIAVHQLIVARETDRRLREAEQKVVDASQEALGIGRL
jgi:hypothetical protein